MRFLVIGNPENRRVALFQEACRRVGLPDIRILPWVRYLGDPSSLRVALQNCDAVRIESPGENAEVSSLLLRKGGMLEIPEYEKGRIWNQAEWYRGWTGVLARLGEVDVPFINRPDEIGLMFDKLTCQKHLREAGVSVPRILGTADGADEVFQLMAESGVNRVFVKPRHSSSASGVVALQRRRKGSLAVTSVKVVREEEVKLFNSLKISRYEKRGEIVELLDLLGAENLMVERWFPKAVLQRRVTDFRVLMIAGKVRHIVARTSRSPLTNLHLGNARGNLQLIQGSIPDETWIGAMADCRRTAANFANCHYLAIDLMIGSDLESWAIAEVNAFGDLLPNLHSEGEDTYEAEIRSWLRSCGQIT